MLGFNKRIADGYDQKGKRNEAQWGDELKTQTRGEKKCCEPGLAEDAEIVGTNLSEMNTEPLLSLYCLGPLKIYLNQHKLFFLKTCENSLYSWQKPSLNNLRIQISEGVNIQCWHTSRSRTCCFFTSAAVLSKRQFCTKRGECCKGCSSRMQRRKTSRHSE